MMFLKGQVSLLKMICYWVGQFTGGLLGAALTWGCTSNIKGYLNDFDGELSRPPFTLGSTTLSPELTQGNGFLIEFMGSLFFYFVIAQTALDKRGIANTPFPAIPIGLVLVVVHILLVPFTGCGVNPARTFGPSMVTCMASSDACPDVAGSWYWIYFIGPFLAAFAVAELTNLLSMDCDEGGEGEEVKESAKDGAALDSEEKIA